MTQSCALELLTGIRDQFQHTRIQMKDPTFSDQPSFCTILRGSRRENLSKLLDFIRDGALKWTKPAHLTWTATVVQIFDVRQGQIEAYIRWRSYLTSPYSNSHLDNVGLNSGSRNSASL
jgi:hypothetical protein